MEAAMGKIFWVTCPKCLKRFYCHAEELLGKNIPLLCPFCGQYFAQEDSPRLDK
jgi:hypothetical protein